jgi:cofilin
VLFSFPLSRAPDTAPTKSKMLYAGSKVSFKNSLVGIGIEVQATDIGEASEETVLDKCKSVSK